MAYGDACMEDGAKLAWASVFIHSCVGLHLSMHMGGTLCKNIYHYANVVGDLGFEHLIHYSLRHLRDHAYRVVEVCFQQHVCGLEVPARGEERLYKG